MINLIYKSLVHTCNAIAMETKIIEGVVSIECKEQKVPFWTPASSLGGKTDLPLLIRKVPLLIRQT